jgi:hypothetical protein
LPDEKVDPNEVLRTFTVTLPEFVKLKQAFPDVLTEDTDNLLYINGEIFDAEDLTYGEKREIRRIIKQDIWDEELDGPYDESKVGENEALPATILVLMRRAHPEADIEDAMAIKPREAYRNPNRNGASPVTLPPTPSQHGSKATPAKSGSQT